MRSALTLADPATCVAGDADGDGVIAIAELIGAAGRNLEGCQRPLSAPSGRRGSRSAPDSVRVGRDDA